MMVVVLVTSWDLTKRREEKKIAGMWLSLLLFSNYFLFYEFSFSLSNFCILLSTVGVNIRSFDFGR